MYLKSKWILVLKFKNVLFFLAGLFLTIMAVWDVVSLTVYYSGDWDTIIHARSTPESAVDFMIGCILLPVVLCRVSMIQTPVHQQKLK